MFGLGLTCTGVRAWLKWRNYPAARLEGYTVVYQRAANRWTLAGTVVERDAYKLTLRPLMFAAVTNKGDWYWPIQSHRLNDNGRLEAVLGAPITEDPTTWDAARWQIVNR